MAQGVLYSRSIGGDARARHGKVTGERDDHTCEGVERYGYSFKNSTLRSTTKKNNCRTQRNPTRASLVYIPKRNRTIYENLYAQDFCQEIVKVFAVWDELCYNGLNEQAPMLVAQQSGAIVTTKE